MASRVLLFVFLLTFGCFVGGVQAQTSSSGTAAATSSETPASKASKKEINAAKKAERVAKRKKRADCYDQAQKESVAGKDITRYLASCMKK